MTTQGRRESVLSLPSKNSYVGLEPEVLRSSGRYRCGTKPPILCEMA